MAEKLGIIGAGKIGTALAQGLIITGKKGADDLWGITRSEAARKVVSETLQCRLASDDCSDLFKDSHAIVVAVKPKQIEGALSSIRDHLRPETLVISLVTGASTKQIDTILGSRFPIVRVITNTGCFVGEAATALSSGPGCTDVHLQYTEDLFRSVGTVYSIDESLCDAVTSLSGSGIAFLLLAIEALTDGGVQLGLPRATAQALAAQVCGGAGKLLLETGRHPASLRDDVTTPAGCTIAGLLVLEDGRLRSTLSSAVREAARIASGLGNE